MAYQKISNTNQHLKISRDLLTLNKSRKKIEKLLHKLFIQNKT